MKNTDPSYIVSSFEGHLIMKNNKIQPPDYLFFERLFQLLHQQIIMVFMNFQNFLQHYLKKISSLDFFLY